MNEQQAVNLFKNEIYPNWKEDIKKDNVKIRCAWLDFVDGMIKDNELKESAYNWDNPFYRE